ncbi:MAG: hypothetical protein RLZZ490_1828 [Cyanobacteriota bacterium]
MWGKLRGSGSWAGGRGDFGARTVVFGEAKSLKSLWGNGFGVVTRITGLWCFPSLCLGAKPRRLIVKLARLFLVNGVGGEVSQLFRAFYFGFLTG